MLTFQQQEMLLIEVKVVQVSLLSQPGRKPEEKWSQAGFVQAARYQKPGLCFGTTKSVAQEHIQGIEVLCTAGNGVQESEMLCTWCMYSHALVCKY